MEQTRYTVPGWGVGELWTSDGVVLAHDFTFAGAVQLVSDTSAAGVSVMSEMSTRDRSIRRLRIAGLHGGSGCGTFDTDLTRLPLDTDRCLTPSALVERFTAFFAGEDVHFDDIALDLSWATPFQRAVAACLRSVPRGEVVSYGELAALAGRPGAQRAVGTFCAKNRFLLLLPCHRVVGAAGLGGYGSAGVTVKRRLLALEGVNL